MSTKDTGYAPYVDSTDGFTDDHLLRCQQLVNTVRPTILNALDEVPSDGAQAFTIGDYATGDGCVSLPNVKEIIRLLRGKYGESLPIQIVYEDQPMNNFNLLVRRIHGLLPKKDSSCLDSYPNVFTLISSKSFYEPCLPPGSLHLGFSSNAMHYLQTIPCKISEALHSTGITDSKQEELFRNQAADEWRQLLLARAKELKPGGRFIVIAGATDKNGYYMGNTDSARGNMLELMTSLWRGLLTDDQITQEEFDDTNFKQYYRTVDEYTAPFNEPNSHIVKAGLELVKIDTVTIRCPYHEHWIKNASKVGTDEKSRRKYAQWFMGSMRYWTNWVFMDALSVKRPVDERQRIVDLYYNMLEDHITDEPGDYHFDEVHAVIDVRKKS